MAAGNSPGIFGFDPLSVPGCQLWLDAFGSANFTFSTGSNISVWRDKSVYGRNLGVGSGTTTFNSTSNAVVLNSSYLFVDRGVDLTNYTMFIVVKSTSATNNQTIFTAKPAAGASSYYSYDGLEFLMDYQTTARNLGLYTPSTSFITLTGEFGNPTVFSLGASGTTGSSWVNGITSNTYTTASTRTGTARGFAIGAEWQDPSSYTNIISTANIYEILVYNTVLTTADRQSIEGYLAWKWGLQTSLGAIGTTATPLTISGCQLWLDGADAATITGTTTVTKWNDKSGNGKHAVTTSNYPSYTSGVPGVYFPGNNILRAPMAAGTFPSGVSMFVVYKFTGAAPSFSAVISRTTGNLGAPFDYYNNTRIVGSGGNYNAYGFPTNIYQTNTTLFSVILTTTTWSEWFNRTSNVSTSVSGYGDNGSNIQIGSRNDLVTRMNGYIYEVVVYNSILTTTQRVQLENYLSVKWGMYQNMHPFALIQPVSRIFQPVDIPGCRLWLDAADATTFSYSSGSNISIWRDKSGNDSSALGAMLTGGAVPTFSNNTVNFGGTGYLLATSVSASSSNEAVFVVARYSSSGNALQGLVGQTSNGGRFFFAQKSDSSLQNGSYNVANGSAGLRLGTPADTNFIGEAITRASDQIVYTNAANAGSSVTVTYTAGTGTVIGVGFNGGIPNSNQTLLGTISEVIIYNVLLTPTQTRDIEGYLAWKWGLSTKLPGTPSTLNFGSQLGLWLDSADASTFSYSSGSNVSQWNDKSGNARHFSNATTSQQPTRVITGQYPYVNFQSNATAGLYNSSLPLFNNTTWDMYCVIKLSTTVGQVAIITEYPGANWIWSTAGAPQMYSLYVTPAAWALGNSVSSGASSATVFQLYQLYSTGSEVGRRINATFAGNRTDQYASYAYPGRTGTRRMGLLNDSPSGQWQSTAGIQMSEILIFNALLPYDERQRVEAYLIQKWGITMPTPVPHPFYRSPSTSVVPSNPLGISNMALWLDAADPAGTGVLPSAGTLATWVDKSGNGRNGTGAGTVPSFALNPSRVTFNGSGYYNTTLSASPTVETIFIVSSTTVTSTMFLIGGSANGSRTIYQLGGSMVTNSHNVATYATQTGALTNGNMFVTGLTLSGGNSQMFVNGTGGTVVGGSTYSGSGTTQIGGIANAASFNGAINEIIVYNTNLTTSQRQAVEGYLAWKWGIQTSLTSTHPYYRFPASYPSVPDFISTPTFIPSSIAGLVVWTDASTVTSVNPWTNGGSGGTINCTGTVNTAARNGRNTVSLTTGQSWTMATTLTLSSYTMFWSGRQTGPNYSRVLQSTSLNQLYGYWGGSKQTLYIDGNPSKLSGLAGNTNWDTFSHGRVAGGAFTFNWDGTSILAGTSTTNSLAGLAINSGVYPGEASQVEIGEIIVYNSVLSTTNIQIVEGYLSWRWGVQANLPVGHPYKNFPP